MRKQKGFSVVELMIVLAIIMIITAIAVPRLLSARISANEAAAVSGTRTLVIAEMQYQASYPSIGYAPKIANLAGTSCASPNSMNACLIDQSMANASPKEGYVYGVAGNASGFSVGGYPVSVGYTGNQSFCALEDGVIHSDGTGADNNATCGNAQGSQTLTQTLTH